MENKEKIESLLSGWISNPHIIGEIVRLQQEEVDKARKEAIQDVASYVHRVTGDEQMASLILTFEDEENGE